MMSNQSAAAATNVTRISLNEFKIGTSKLLSVSSSPIQIKKIQGDEEIKSTATMVVDDEGSMTSDETIMLSKLSSSLFEQQQTGHLLAGSGGGSFNDGANATAHTASNSVLDDSLTSLTWLQNLNLLKSGASQNSDILLKTSSTTDINNNNNSNSNCNSSNASSMSSLSDVIPTGASTPMTYDLEDMNAGTNSTSSSGSSTSGTIVGKSNTSFSISYPPLSPPLSVQCSTSPKSTCSSTASAKTPNKKNNKKSTDNQTWQKSTETNNNNTKSKLDEIGIEISTSKSTIVQQHTKSTVSPLAIVATAGVTLQHQISAPAQLTSEQSSMSKAASTATASNNNKNGSFLFLKDREDFRTNSHIKPPYSYSQLIILSMKESNYAKMTLQMIYDWIIENFSYFKKADPNWQVTFKNSIRHNLSLNKCFRKIARQKDEPGKGGFWTLDPDFEKQLNESNFLNSNSSSSSCASPSSASANKISNVLGAQQPTDLKALKRRRKSSTSDQTSKSAGGSSSSAKTIRTLQSESKKFKSAGNDSTGNNSSFSSSSTSSSSSSSSFISSSTESNLTSSPNGNNNNNNNNNWQAVVTKSQPPSSSSLQSQSNYFTASTPGYGHNCNVNTRNPTISSSFAHHSTASNHPHQHHPHHNHQFNGDYINGPSGIINSSGSHNHHHLHNHQYLDHSLLSLDQMNNMTGVASLNQMNTFNNVGMGHHHHQQQPNEPSNQHYYPVAQSNHHQNSHHHNNHHSHQHPNHHHHHHSINGNNNSHQLQPHPHHPHHHNHHHHHHQSQYPAHLHSTSAQLDDMNGPFSSSFSNEIIRTIDDEGGFFNFDTALDCNFDIDQLTDETHSSVVSQATLPPLPHVTYQQTNDRPPNLLQKFPSQPALPVSAAPMPSHPNYSISYHPDAELIELFEYTSQFNLDETSSSNAFLSQSSGGSSGIGIANGSDTLNTNENSTSAATSVSGGSSSSSSSPTAVDQITKSKLDLTIQGHGIKQPKWWIESVLNNNPTMASTLNGNGASYQLAESFNDHINGVDCVNNITASNNSQTTTTTNSNNGHKQKTNDELDDECDSGAFISQANSSHDSLTCSMDNFLDVNNYLNPSLLFNPDHHSNFNNNNNNNNNDLDTSGNVKIAQPKNVEIKTEPTSSVRPKKSFNTFNNIKIIRAIGPKTAKIINLNKTEKCAN